MFKYHISTGIMEQNGKTMPGECYSGTPEARNDPSKVAVQNVGPIPPGKYRIGFSYTDPDKGPLVMRLMALVGTQTYGRGGFLIHGDSRAHPGAASHGCIIAPHDMRAEIDRARDRVLEVVA